MADARIIVRVSGSAGAFRATVQVDRLGAIARERVLEDGDCGELSEALAVLISLLIQPAPPVWVEGAFASEEPPPGPPAAPVVEEEAVAPAPPETPPPHAPVETPVGVPATRGTVDPVRFELAGSAGALVGLLPDLTAVFRLSAGLGARDWAVRVDARVALDSNLQTSGNTASVGWVGGTIAGCGRVDFVHVCGHVTLGRVAGTAVGIDVPRTAEALTAAIGAEVAARWAILTWLALDATLGAEVFMLRPEAWLDHTRRWASEPLAGYLTLGVSLTVP